MKKDGNEDLSDRCYVMYEGQGLIIVLWHNIEI